MRNVRKITALSLLSIYLLSIVGAVCVVLNCDCVHTHRHGEHSHYCTGGCCHVGPCSHTAKYDEASLPEISGVCCDHDHSTSTALYTADSERDHSFRAVTHTADAVAWDAAPAVPSVCESAETYLSPAPDVRSAASPSRALRAPPVCA